MIPNAKDYKSDPAKTRELVESIDMTQQAIADQIGVDRRTIQNWISGKKKCSFCAFFTLQSLQEGTNGQ